MSTGGPTYAVHSAPQRFLDPQQLASLSSSLLRQPCPLQASQCHHIHFVAGVKGTDASECIAVMSGPPNHYQRFMADMSITVVWLCRCWLCLMLCTDAAALGRSSIRMDWEYNHDVKLEVNYSMPVGLP